MIRDNMLWHLKSRLKKPHNSASPISVSPQGYMVCKVTPSVQTTHWINSKTKTHGTTGHTSNLYNK